MTLLQALATSVAQLYIAPPENRRVWWKEATGVICFVKDNGKKSYFLRMYSLVVSSEQVPLQLQFRLYHVGQCVDFLHRIVDQVVRMGTGALQLVQIHSHTALFPHFRR